MKVALLACAFLLSGCAAPNWGPVSARQRAEANTDVPEDHPHPPATILPVPLDPSFDKLHCWNNGEDTVCSRQPD
jgi:hypothetical protein